jgi:hypothetical protein
MPCFTSAGRAAFCYGSNCEHGFITRGGHRVVAETYQARHLHRAKSRFYSLTHLIQTIGEVKHEQSEKIRSRHQLYYRARNMKRHITPTGFGDGEVKFMTPLWDRFLFSGRTNSSNIALLPTCRKQAAGTARNSDQPAFLMNWDSHPHSTTTRMCN